MDDRILAQNGDYSWLTDQYDIRSGGSRLNLMNYSPLRRAPRHRSAAAALYKVTGEPEYKKTADYCIEKTTKGLGDALPTMERYQIPLGYGGGVGGFIAGLETAAEYTGNENGTKAAEKLFSGITEKLVSSDGWLDVLGGASGLVLALTRGRGTCGSRRENRRLAGFWNGAESIFWKKRAARDRRRHLVGAANRLPSR